MAKPPPPAKSPKPPGGRTRMRTLDILIVVIGFLGIIGYNRLSIARLQRSLPNANNLIVGEWKSKYGNEHLIFRPDKTVSLIVVQAPAPATTTDGQQPDAKAPEAASNGGGETPLMAPPVEGKYQLTEGGKIYIQLTNGKKYSTLIQPANKNRFDLIDSFTEGVTTYERQPTGAPPPEPKSSKG
ncbi:MAG TPA: hypothetical protein VEK34_00755 [Methylocella sp.]|nr:hypothetical protein [Methylocella sp.]